MILLGLLSMFALLKSRHANKIWLSIGQCLEIGSCLETSHFNHNHDKLLKTLRKKRVALFCWPAIPSSPLGGGHEPFGWW